MSRLLFIPTPVGNLEDMSPRAIRLLAEADRILTEDTRTSGRLLKHFGITTPMIPFHQHNEHRLLPSVMEALLKGECMALISDAGTPGISDPAFLLVRACIEQSIPVEALPGPTAFVPALVASGIPCDRFCFEGFLPVKKGRKGRLEQLVQEKRTMVFYESPHRLLRTLADLGDAFGAERRACVSREISKMHEEHVRGSLQELHTIFSERKIKGEITLVVSGFVV